MSIDQWWIAIFGPTAIFLSMSPRPEVARFGPVLGMISQPAWYIASIAAEQWGILFLSVLYTMSWCRGLYTHWGPTVVRWWKGC